MPRCSWCTANESLQTYHDAEWGVPLHEDRKQFEFLMLEALQCGLSWNLMLQKREVFHRCFDDFDFEKVACYGEADIQRIMETPGMLRSRRKIEAVIHNARRFLEIRGEFGSFCDYLWAFTDGCMLIYHCHPDGRMPPKNALSERIAADLRRRGFKYLGPTTVYSHLQSCGIINDHYATCARFCEVQKNHPVRWLEPEGEP